jgi:hypothetical protein
VLPRRRVVPQSSGRHDWQRRTCAKLQNGRIAGHERIVAAGDCRRHFANRQVVFAQVVLEHDLGGQVGTRAARRERGDDTLVSKEDLHGTS